MPQLSPTLAALALISLVPAFGANIADDLTIKVKAQIQVRGEFGANGHDDGGNDYNLYNGANGANEAARFGIRRARFGAEASNTTGWKGVIQFRGAESYDTGALGASATTANSQTRPVEVYYANVNKTFKADALEHEIGFGLDKPFNSESSMSSTTFMFPSDRVVAKMIETRNVGLGYKLTGLNLFRAGINVQNGSGTGYTDSTDTNAGAAGTQTSGEKNGLFYSGRIEFSPLPELFIAKKQESFAGGEGTGVLIGFDYQNSNRQFDATPATKEVTTTTMGPDLLVHVNGLTLVADYRWRNASTESVQSSTTPVYDKPARMWDVLVGYAIDTGAGFQVEPALRYEVVDLDTDKSADSTGMTPSVANNDNATKPYSGGEFTGAQSGREWSLGVNLYWNGHANKTQLSYSNFTGETTANINGGNAAAHVFIIQHQLTF